MNKISMTYIMFWSGSSMTTWVVNLTLRWTMYKC